MSYRIFKRPQAERDIEECFVFIAEENLDTGVYFLVAVEDSLEQLAKFPLIGKQSEFQNKQFQNLRMWHVKGYENYLIFYTVIEETIEVIRVLYASRDIKDVFS
ncbi:MAG: type II toxin-antitoxin system RelE/ParE family toxin [Acidobacteria bacterium]|jgi:toxin ParE1/3/4|nr:type II toxin-antitoxin system RelE/ParE family toxin [Acidobacteriota bacterium]